MIGTLIPQVGRATQAAASVSSAARAVTNLMKILGTASGLKGFLGLDFLAKDIGGFEFDYIHEQRMEAGSSITEHWTENNFFLQDHVALKPVRLVLRGYVADVKQTRTQAVGIIGALTAVLSPVAPYMTKYTPGTAAKMGSAIQTAFAVEGQLRNAISTGTAVVKTVGTIAGVAGLMPTACQKAFKTLEGLRELQYRFAVVTPFKTYKNMMMENLVMVSPEDTRGYTDITVTLKEIRTTADLVQTGANNGGVDQTPTSNGSTSGGVVA